MQIIKKEHFYIKLSYYSIEKRRKRIYNIDINHYGGIMDNKLKKLFIDYIPMALTAILIITFAIINKQSFIKTLPTLVTLCVQILVVRANRIAFLIGGTNSLLYAIAPWSEGLYFSVVSCVCISAPIQYMSFFIWKKKKSKRNSRNTELKFLGIGKCLLVIAATFAVWLPTYLLLRPFFEGALALLDSFTFVLGITISLLSAFRYIDSQYLNIFSCFLAIVMWGVICIESPNNLNYMVISCYNLFMVAKAAINWTKQYKNDKREKESVINENEIVASASSEGK